MVREETKSCQKFLHKSRWSLQSTRWVPGKDSDNHKMNRIQGVWHHGGGHCRSFVSLAAKSNEEMIIPLPNIKSLSNWIRHLTVCLVCLVFFFFPGALDLPMKPLSRIERRVRHVVGKNTMSRWSGRLRRANDSFWPTARKCIIPTVGVVCLNFPGLCEAIMCSRLLRTLRLLSRRRPAGVNTISLSMDNPFLPFPKSFV